MFMPANARNADPRPALPEGAYQLQRAATALRDHASNAQQVPTLPATLAHVHDTLDLLAVSIQRMAQAVADCCGADGRNVDEDAASPEARALRWHLGTTAEALRDSRDASSASAAWARRLLAEPLDTDEDPAPPTALEGSRERSGSPAALDMGCRAPGAGR
jgi:hypothetical protein